MFLVLNWQFLTWIWRPDTYFMNGYDSYLHKVAVPNRFIRSAIALDTNTVTVTVTDCH